MIQQSERISVDEKYKMLLGGNDTQYNPSAKQPSLAQPSTYKSMPSFGWSSSSIPDYLISQNK